MLQKEEIEKYWSSILKYDEQDITAIQSFRREVEVIDEVMYDSITCQIELRNVSQAQYAEVLAPTLNLRTKGGVTYTFSATRKLTDREKAINTTPWPVSNPRAFEDTEEMSMKRAAESESFMQRKQRGKGAFHYRVK